MNDNRHDTAPPIAIVLAKSVEAEIVLRVKLDADSEIKHGEAVILTGTRVQKAAQLKTALRSIARRLEKALIE